MVPLYHILQEVPEANWNSSMMIYQWVAGAAKFYLEDWLKVDANRPSGMGFIYPEKVFLSQVNGVDLIPANEAKIRAQMKQQATLDMLSNYKVERIECDVLQNRFYYLQDYDLGDVCSVVIDEIQQSFTARIIEVREVHAANKVDIQVVLGTPNKREYRKVG